MQTRRKFLLGVSTISSIALAGCVGGDDIDPGLYTEYGQGDNFVDVDITVDENSTGTVTIEANSAGTSNAVFVNVGGRPIPNNTLLDDGDTVIVEPHQYIDDDDTVLPIEINAIYDNAEGIIYLYYPFYGFGEEVPNDISAS